MNKIFSNHKPKKNIQDPFNDGHYALNRKLCEILGIWPEQKLSTRICLQIMHVLITWSILIPQIVAFAKIYRDLDRAADNLASFFTAAAVAIKFFTMGLNSHVFKQAFNYVREDWVKYGESFAQEILYKYSEKGRSGTIMYATCLGFAAVLFVTLPTVPLILDVIIPLNESRKLFPIFETEYGVDQEKYFMIITTHACLIVFQVVGIIITVDTIVLVLVQHCCSLFRIVELILNRLNDETIPNLEKFQYDTVSEAIKLHIRATELAHFLNSSLSNMYAAVVIITLVGISVTGLKTVILIKKNHYDQVLRFVIFTTCDIIHLFLNSMAGQELFNGSEEELKIIYNCNWIALSTKSRKLIRFSMMRTLKPCALAAGGFYVMNMENFRSVVQTSMSYLTVLSSAY